MTLLERHLTFTERKTLALFSALQSFRVWADTNPVKMQLIFWPPLFASLLGWWGLAFAIVVMYSIFAAQLIRWDKFYANKLYALSVKYKDRYDCRRTL